MAGSRKARVRRDGNFDDAEAFHFDQGGKEPVRAVEKLHVGDAFALKCTIGATGVADRFSGEFVADPVGNSRRNNSKPVISRFPRRDSCATDTISTIESLDECGEVL